jgi:hypothetical protein
VCTPNDAGGENCGEEWVDATEPPEVEGGLFVSVPAISGALNYAADGDVFEFTDMNLGDSTTTVKIGADNVISFDLNPNDGRMMNLALSGAADQDIVFQLSPTLDAQASIGAWHKVTSAIEGAPSLSQDESLGIRFEGSDAPELTIFVANKDNIQFQVSSGELRLSSSAMSADVIIQEGMCMTGADTDALSEEEKEALHDLFGEMTGATCEP